MGNGKKIPPFFHLLVLRKDRSKTCARRNLTRLFCLSKEGARSVGTLVPWSIGAKDQRPCVFWSFAGFIAHGFALYFALRIETACHFPNPQFLTGQNDPYFSHDRVSAGRFEHLPAKSAAQYVQNRWPDATNNGEIMATSLPQWNELTIIMDASHPTFGFDLHNIGVTPN